MKNDRDKYTNIVCLECPITVGVWDRNINYSSWYDQIGQGYGTPCCSYYKDKDEFCFISPNLWDPT